MIGLVGVPPWIHSLLASAASFDCSSVSSIVVAPAIVFRRSAGPMPLSNGTLSAVTIVGLNGPVTLLSEPHEPVTARDL